MGQAGLLQCEHRVEPLDGAHSRDCPSVRHTFHSDVWTRTLRGAHNSLGFVLCDRKTGRLSEFSATQFDGIMLRGDSRNCRDRYFETDETGLVIGINDSRLDRILKQTPSAIAGIGDRLNREWDGAATRGLLHAVSD